MTLPSEGINPWRTVPAQGGPIASPNRIPTENLLDTDPKAALSGAPASTDDFKPFGDDGFTFRDFIDIINPLQHIPLISTAYRNMTEDQLDPVPRILGGTLFMGPIGLAASIANVVVEHNTGKDLGEHVVAYFDDDAAPLGAASKTAQASPVAAGTDGVDPVTAWAQEQNAFYQKGVQNDAMAAEGGDDGASVAAWAQAQNEFYRTGQTPTTQQTAGNVDDVAAWAAAQQAYYQQTPQTPAMTQVATADTPVAKATQRRDQAAADPVTAWAQAQTAAYGTHPQKARQSIELAETGRAPVAAGTDGIDPVTAWAQAQTAAYGSTQPQARQTIELAETARAPVVAGTDGIDPVTAWAQAQTAAYGSTQPQARPSIELAETARTPVAAGTDGSDPVTAWAQAQLAWVHGDRAQEVAATTNTADSRRSRLPQSTAATEKASRFQDNMVAGWAKYQAAQQLAAPGYRPDMAVRDLRR